MLGDILRQLNDETAAHGTLLGASDVTLVAAARERSASEGVDLTTCVVETVQRYTAQASDEEWITLIGMLNRAPDPGAAYLRRAFACAL
jgi:hydroxypyruvate isomerase